MKKIFALVILFCLITGSVASAQGDSLSLSPREKRKKGWSFNPLPVVSYDSDLGFQFGALCQVIDYGDGSVYPDYKHMFYGEVSWFTKGSALYQFIYDSKHLVPGGIRTTAVVEYNTERAVDFYGFNGYEARYIPSVAQTGTSDYISRMFYRHDRRTLRIVTDFQGPLAGQKLRWLAGLSVMDIRTATVNIAKINKGKPDDKILPDTSLLYDQYVKYGVIRPEEKEGGSTVYLRAGLVVDTRDKEAAPDKGVWSEALVIAAPTFLGNNPYAFVRLAITHRQYISIFRDHLVAAYRLSYQGTIGGTTPYYILPYIYGSFITASKSDGLGGAKTLRGILRNRITGDGIALGNVELRWKFLNTRILKQNLYLCLVGFLDGGMAVQPHPVYPTNIPENQREFYLDQSSDNLHLAAGLGLRIAFNQNFIISFDYGRALDTRDGIDGMYLSIGHVF